LALWLSVYQAREKGIELPPVTLYKVGEAYFVVDGHHRVSVARQRGQEFIDAEVIEVQTKVPVTPDIRLEDLEILGEYRQFLEQTHLDKLRPEQNIRFSVPGNYSTLLEHIRVHRYFMGLEQQREVSWKEAVAHWYDTIYMPVIQAIRSKDILKDFPGRTEADLYIWIMEHAHYLREEFDQEIPIEEVITDFADRYSPKLQRVIERAERQIIEKIIPDELGDGPPPGRWREERVAEGRPTRLFKTILCPVSGSEAGWRALEQAAEIARREKGRLIGLHVLSDDATEVYAEEHARVILSEFARRCEEQGVPHTESLERGDPAQVIVARGRWVDLIAMPRQQAHDHWPGLALGSIFQTVVQRAASPVLTAPVKVTPMRRVLLAYDGSPKADEALFVVSYLAMTWQTSVVLLTAQDSSSAEQILETAQRYLAERGITDVHPILAEGAAHAAILKAAEEQDCDMIAMGGYGLKPLLKAFLGSTVDRVLRDTPLPVLICR